MHEDTRIALISLGIGVLITGLFLAVGRPLVLDIDLLAGITIGVGTFLALKHWGRRRDTRSTTDQHLKEIREIAATTDYLADEPDTVPQPGTTGRELRRQAG